MGKSLEDITQLTIDSGKGVLSAIVREAKKNGILFTRRELSKFGNEICARLDRDKLRKDCIVQPGQVIELNMPKKNLNIGKVEALTGYQGAEGFEKHTDPSGKVTYMLNGKEMPQTK